MPTLARFTAAALLLTLAACADSSATPTTTPATATPPATGSATPGTASPPPPTAATPTPSAGPQAADGNDLAACKDGDCEVDIKVDDRIAIDKRFGVERLTVSSLDAEEVRVTLLGSSGGLRVEGMNVSVSGNCVNGRCRDEGNLSLAPGRPGRINDLQVEVTHLTDERAILRLSPE